MVSYCFLLFRCLGAPKIYVVSFFVISVTVVTNTAQLPFFYLQYVLHINTDAHVPPLRRSRAAHACSVKRALRSIKVTGHYL